MRRRDATGSAGVTSVIIIADAAADLASRWNLSGESTSVIPAWATVSSVAAAVMAIVGSGPMSLPSTAAASSPSVIDMAGGSLWYAGRARRGGKTRKAGRPSQD